MTQDEPQSNDSDDPRIRPGEMWQLQDEEGNIILEVGQVDGEPVIDLYDDDYSVHPGWPGT